MTTPGQGQQGPLPIPGTAGSTPLTPMSEQIEAVKHGQLPTGPGGHDPNNPGSWEEQIQRAAYLHQAGLPQDPEPDHGGKGYEFDPETLPALIREFEGIAHDSHTFEQDIRQAAKLASPPAPDKKSIEYVHAYQASLDKAANQAKGASIYLDNLVQSMKKALADYQQNEEHNAQDLRRNKA